MDIKKGCPQRVHPNQTADHGRWAGPGQSGQGLGGGSPEAVSHTFCSGLDLTSIFLPSTCEKYACNRR